MVRDQEKGVDFEFKHKCRVLCPFECVFPMLNLLLQWRGFYGRGAEPVFIGCKEVELVAPIHFVLTLGWEI